MNTKFTDDEWLLIFQQRTQSGLSVRKWCDSNQISYDKYKYWEKKLSRRSDPERAVSPMDFVELPQALLPPLSLEREQSYPFELSFHAQRPSSTLVADYDTWKKVHRYMENTTPLCGEGNCVLAGHNGSRRGSYFTNLSSAKAGTEVKLTTQEGVTHCYTVEEMRVVSPYDTWVTEDSETEMLTLFTCAEHGTRRFACRCVPVEDYGAERGDADSE